MGLSSLTVACVLVLPSTARAEERNESSRQALLEAIRAADTDRVRQLLRRGAEVNSCSEDGTTALMHATAVGDVALVRMLLDHKADVNARNKAGATALMWAVGDGEKVRALLERAREFSP